MGRGFRVTSSSLAESTADEIHASSRRAQLGQAMSSAPSSGRKTEQSDLTDTVSPGCSAQGLALYTLRVAIEQKSLDPCALEVCALTDIADYFVLASATSPRHAQGIADNIQRALKAVGEKPQHVVGYEDSTWIVLDYGDVVTHIFHEPVRKYYDLDGLWSSAPRLPVPVELQAELHLLRTGMYF